VTDDLPDRAIAATGGRQLWNRLCGLRIDISIGGPIWTMKGWPPEQTVDQILGADTANEHIVFTPFTRPDSQMVFDTAADAVTTQTLDAQQCKRCRPRGPGTTGMLRNSDWDAAHLGQLIWLHVLERLRHPVPVHLPQCGGPSNRARPAATG
jgi:hypothetical protein